MAREYRPNVRESAVISKLDHDKESHRFQAINQLRQHMDTLSSLIAGKLIEERLVETTSKDELETQIHLALETLPTLDDFEFQFQVANVRSLVPRPHFVSLYVTAYIIEKLINHRCVLEIFGTDEDIYRCVDRQVSRFIPPA